MKSIVTKRWSELKIEPYDSYVVTPGESGAATARPTLQRFTADQAVLA